MNQTMKLLALFAMASAPAVAQSNTEKVKAGANDVKREVKKDAHRVEEELCTGTKAQCAGRKVKHRAQEGKDSVVDEGKELKDKVDADGK
jgi:hypothetical protein